MSYFLQEAKQVEPQQEYTNIFERFISLCREQAPEDFIIKRNYDTKVIMDLNIGFCNSNVYEVLREEYDLETLRKAGFWKGKKATYNNCVIIPHSNSYFSARGEDNKNLYPLKDVAGSKIPLKVLTDSKTFILVEGETDLIACKHIFPKDNILSAGGVNSATKLLKLIPEGSKVLVCFDNDEKGIEGKNKVCEELDKGYFDYEVVCFDKQYKDIDELFRDKQQKSIDFITFEKSKLKQELDSMDIISFQELLKRDIQPVKYIVDNLIAEEGITFIGGDSGVGKTWLSLYIALKVSNGYKLFDTFNSTKSSVVYLDEENGDRAIFTRTKMLLPFFDMKNEKPDFKNIFYSNMENIKLDKGKFDKDKAGWLKFEHAMEKYKPKLCIIDSFVNFFLGDENNSSDISKVFETLKLAKKKYKTAFVILHHTVKNYKPSRNNSAKHSLRGSGNITAQADNVLMCSKTFGTNKVLIRQEKNRHDKELDKPFQVLIDTFDGTFSISYGGDLTIEQNDEYQKGLLVLAEIILENDWEEMNSGFARKKFMAKGFSSRAYFDILKTFTTEKLLENIKKGLYKVNFNKLQAYYDDLQELEEE